MSGCGGVSPSEPANQPRVMPALALHQIIEREAAVLWREVTLYVHKHGQRDRSNQLVVSPEEVFQEAVLRALRRADDYDPARSAHAWLMGFAIRVLIELQRKHWRRQGNLVSLPRRDEDDAAAPDPFERLVETAQQDGHLLFELLDLVAPADRRLIELAVVHDLSGRELAAALGVAEGTARVQLHRAKQRLRAAWQRAQAAGEEVN